MHTQNLLDNERSKNTYYAHRRGWFDSWRWEYCISKNIEFGNLLSLQVHFAQGNFKRLCIKFLGVSLYVSITRWDDYHDVGYGFYTDYDALVILWGRGDFSDEGFIKFFYVPWSWGAAVSSEVLSDGEFVPKIYDGDKKDNRTVYTSPYTYILRDGTVQRVTASYYVERSVWYWRIFRKWKIGPKKVYVGIWVDFSSEVGEGTGSWKGGALGCGYEMLPHEWPIEALRRMELERKF